MNPVSAGCGDNLEDGKVGNADGTMQNTTGGWFWISDPATNNKKMRTSQSTSSLQLFTIKSNKPMNNSRPDKGASASPGNTDDQQEEPMNDDDKRNVALRRSVSLLDITTLDKDRMRDESEMMKVVTSSAIEEEKGASGIEFKGFGDVGVKSCLASDSVSSRCSDNGDDHPNQDGDLQKSAEMEAEVMNTHNGKKEDGYMSTDDFNKLQQREQKLNKSQATARMLHKANIGYQHDITNLTKTLEDESETRRILHEELEASRKLCCELYENLLQERTHCRSTNISEVERHLSPDALKFSLSDAAVQTDVDHVDFSIQTEQNQLLDFESKENVSTGCLLAMEGSSFPQEIPRYGFYLSHLLEEYKENQKNLEVQLKSLSTQCREKDEDLKSVKDKLAGHIRFNTLLQSEKVCLEETVEQLREEVKSCDHLLQSCDSVLREKDREIRELIVKKYELERRVAEYEFKEKEMQGMVSGFQEDIGDLASERKKLRKCVKKASRFKSPSQQVKVPEPIKEVIDEREVELEVKVPETIKKANDEREIELQAKAELLNAIREIAFKISTSPRKAINPGLKADEGEKGASVEGQQRKQSTGDDAKEGYRALFVKESDLFTMENSLIRKKSSECSINNYSMLTYRYDSCASELDSENDEGQRHENITCLSRNQAREIARERKRLENTGHLTKEKFKINSTEERSMRDSDGQGMKVSCVLHRSSHHGDLPSLDRSEDKGEKAEDNVTLSCHNLYSDVMNELSCKNAAAAMPMVTPTTATEDAAEVPSSGTYDRDCVSLEDVSSGDNDDQLRSEEWRASGESLPESLGSSSDDCLDDCTQINVQHATNKTTASRKLMDSVEEEEDSEDISDDDGYDLKFYKMQKHLSSNNSNESEYAKGNDAQTVESHKFPDSFAITKGTKPNQVDEVTDPKLISETSNDLLSWESPQRLGEMENGDVSSSHRIIALSGDELQEDDLEFCVAEEDYDIRDHNKEKEISDASLDYDEDSTAYWHERDQELATLSMHPKNVNQDTGRLPIRNRIIQGEQHFEMSSGQRKSPNPTKIKKDVTNRYMKGSSLDPEVSERKIPHRIAFGTKDIDRGGANYQRTTLEDPFSVRHSQHVRYRSPEDSDDLHIEGIHDLNGTDSDGSVGSCDSYGEASPAEGLILRKQVMENYATRANDRAWHYVYMKQEGSRLMFYKDRMGKELGANIEEPLVLTNAIISVAKDYFRRKHVFRVQLQNGHQYLFAAKDDREMMFWVCRLDASGAHSMYRHDHGYSRLPAAITTIPPPTSGSPTRSERLKNMIKGGISALLK